MKLEQTLKDYGLKDKQIKVYLACLQLGTGPVVKIAQKAGMPRSTVYEILESLRGLNLVATFLKKKVRYFSAEEPEHLIRFAETKVNLLKDVLPELNALTGKSRQRPAVRFYQGKDQMQIILNEVLDEAEELIAFGVSEDLLSLMSDYHKTFIATRLKRKIPLRIILRDSSTARQRKQLGTGELRNVKIIPATHNYHGLTYVWKNKIAMFAFVGDLVAVVIESKELADMQRAMMEYLWEKI